MSITDTQSPAVLEDGAAVLADADVLVDDAELEAPLSLRERGMVTAEYVVGIIAAITLALVLLKVFKADSFFTWIFDIISGIFKAITGLIP